MTAKEKAEELFDKMSFEVCRTDAKICALKAVDEIICECLNWSGGSMDNGWDIKRFDYWEEVKQEINKL